MSWTDEENLPRRRPALERPRFDGWDVGQLRAYVEELRGEIARAEAAIESGLAQKAAAEAFFRKP